MSRRSRLVMWVIGLVLILGAGASAINWIQDTEMPEQPTDVAALAASLKGTREIDADSLPNDVRVMGWSNSAFIVAPEGRKNMSCSTQLGALIGMIGRVNGRLLVIYYNTAWTDTRNPGDSGPCEDGDILEISRELFSSSDYKVFLDSVRQEMRADQIRKNRINDLLDDYNKNKK